MDRQYENVDVTSTFCQSQFNPVLIHPEEEPNTNEINTCLFQIKDDLKTLDSNIATAAEKIKGLLEFTRIKLSEIKTDLNQEKERQEDINILCNKYTDFSTVFTLNKEDYSGNLNHVDGIITAQEKSLDKISYSIKNIDGNGYEGNKYVYLNDSFVNDILDTSNRGAISDNNIATYYEYSRVTINNDIEEAPLLFNKDSGDSECSIELESKDEINKLVIQSDRKDLILQKVFTSTDGQTYSLDREYNILLNDRHERYNNQGYIYGSGIIAFEPTKYIKLLFKSNGYTDDSIAFIKTFYNENEKVIKKIEKINSAKRHVVKINNMALYKSIYIKGMIVSKELITTPVNSIALYCNEYINKDYTIENNIDYYLIINGIEQKIVPINSSRNGKKIIRISAQTYKSEHVIYTNETIKSAKLKIVINTPNANVTPFISDVKILVGGEK